MTPTELKCCLRDARSRQMDAENKLSILESLPKYTLPTNDMNTDHKNFYEELKTLDGRGHNFGRTLKEIWDIKCHTSLFQKNGEWYGNPGWEKRVGFPLALCDQYGYLLIPTVEDFEQRFGEIPKRLNLQQPVSMLRGYLRVRNCD